MDKKTKKIIPTFSISLDQMYLDTKQPKKHQQRFKKYLLDKQQPKETTMIKKDPFGFASAINTDKLNDPNVLKTLEEIFKDKPLYDKPEVSYKKAVNTLKRSIKR